MSEEKKSYTREEFAKMYQEMVDKTGFQIIANPVWMPTNHGTFEMSIQMTIAKLPEKV